MLELDHGTEGSLGRCHLLSADHPVLTEWQQVQIKNAETYIETE